MNLSHIISAWLAMAPAGQPEGPSKADLEAILRVAEAELVQLYGRCSAEGAANPGAAPAPAGAGLVPVPGTGVDREAQLGFLRVAEMRRMVAENYPYAKLGSEGPKIHTDDVHIAVQQFEMAFACEPVWEQRRYLDEALELVLARRDQIRDVEKRAGASAEFMQLAEDEARLRQKLGKLRRPPCPATTTGCHGVIHANPVEPEQGAKRGYRARLMDLLSLRLEFGGGFKAVLQTPMGSRRDGLPFVTSIAPGVRLLAGENGRHVFGLGFRYTLLAYVGEGYHASQMSARFEYGVRAHPRWFSIHGSFEPGLQTHPRRESFGHTQIGGSGSLCTWNEALCLRFGGSAAVGQRDGAELGVGFATFGLDLFRVIDNRLRGQEGQP